MAERSARFFNAAVDGGPGVLFIVVYLATRDFRLATMVLVAAAAVSLAAMLIVERRFRPLPTTIGGLALVFGGASLLLNDPNILKMKMSIVDGLLGAALFGGLVIGKNPLKMILGSAFELTDKAWATLAIRYGVFWWACAIANEIVRRTQSDHTWVLFRGGALAAAVIFAVAQTPFILKHNALATDGDVPPPDLGL